MESNYYLALQSSYQFLQLALFSEKECIEKIVQQDVRASSYLVTSIDTLLQKHNIALSSLKFIAVDKGPGAFTSLRVAIATVNGIGFNQTIPLVGVDGLEALMCDGYKYVALHQLKVAGILGLLNAYSDDAYYYSSSINSSIIRHKGCKNIHEVIADVTRMIPEGPLLILGNGGNVFKDTLFKAYGDRCVFQNPLQEAASVESIGMIGSQLWHEQDAISYRITPNYLKSQLFTMKR